MSNYRDDVRDMLKTLKGAKPSTASPDSSKPAESESPEPAGKLEKGAEGASEKKAKGAKKEGAASDLPLSDEEDLLDDILDLEEGEGDNNGKEIEDIDAEAEALLADSDNEESEEKDKSAEKIKPDSKMKDSSNGKDKSESPKIEELDDSNEKTENGKEDEQVEKMDESTGEETETAEVEKIETSKLEKTEKGEVEETEENTEVKKTEEKTETAEVQKTEEKTETAEVEKTKEKETEKDKEIDEKIEKIKTSEKTTEEEESAEAYALLASDDEEIKEAKIDDKSKKESEEILSPKSREERAKYKASLPKKGKKNSEVIDEKELENSEPEIETIESDDDDVIAEVLETESSNKKKVDTTEVTLVDDTPDDSNSIEEINDETPADSIAQISDDETEEKDEDSKQQSEVEEITEETETEIPAEPCTPHCPGASGFPDLECTRCQSLFHSKCVGVEETDRSTFKCRICTPVPAVRSLESKQPVRKEKPKGKNLMANAMAKAQKMAEDAVECVDLSSDDENADTGNGTSRSRKTKAKGYVTEEETTSEEDVDETGDPDKLPGEGSEKEITPDFLAPFNFGWRREVVFRQARRGTATNCDVYYIPPQDGRYRTREAKRKRRSKKDQERYFEDFPDDDLSIKNFNYVKKPMGMNNAAYEVVRQAKLQDAFDKDEAVREEKAAARKSMKEVEESAGLLERPSDDDLDDEVKLINGFDLGTPLTLQATQHVTGMQNENKNRRKFRDPETCCTPPLVEDQLWSNLSDDPVGVYTDLGGRSSPVTPPPLRAVKLTYVGTREKILKALQDVKDEAFKFDSTKELELIEEQATHDYLIKKFKNYKAASKWDEDWCPDKNYKPGPGRPPKEPGARGPRGPYKKTQNRGGLSSSIMSGAMNRACTPKCPGSYGILPSLQCVGCKAMFHAKCQGTPISPNMRVFRCRRCSSRGSSNQNSSKSDSNNFAVGNGTSVKLKLPMLPKGGKRPIVELVLRTPEGRYQPIKFRNNSQITENIPRTLFHKANQAKKTLYVKSQQLPRLNGKPVFLAINPHSGPAGPGRPPKASHDDPDWSASPSQKRAAGPPPTGDQVAILVRPQQAASNSKPVLLNVPRKVALKVKVGTTLSFSASNDHKYVVMDSKIHPPVGTGQRAPNRGPGRPSGPGPNKNRLPSSLSVIRNSPGSGRPQNSLSNLMNNKRPGLTITRGPQGYPGSYIPAKKARKSLPSGSNILASGEVVTAPTASYTEPCTPYCPGVSGFPDLECTRCQSLFHSKCVGINELLVDRIRSTFKCRICTPVPVLSRPTPKPARPKSLGGGSVTVINLD